ncbi:MAG: phosphatase PAP2 family protein [Bacteroidetes bacterium]|nr:phosphatase PAP2 family protein [Bacteroidota bacterium]
MLGVLFSIQPVHAEEKNEPGIIPAEVNAAAVQLYTVSPALELEYRRPKPFTFITSIPKDVVNVYKRSFRKENVPMIAMILAETALMIPGDQGMIDGAKSIGKTFNIAPTAHQKPIVEFTVKTKTKNFTFPIGFPDDVNSSLYFLGDGITHTSIALGFFGYGAITKNYRALQTGSQIAESMIASGIVVQFLKHTTGRESPFASSSPGGVWRVLPNQFDYANHVPKYDAYPSGHIATAVGTVTVIAENYPEHKLIRPIGYSLCGLLAFAMMNNGVHWASDYPLGIALGYTFAKVAVAHGRNEIRRSEESSAGNTFSKRKRNRKPAVFPSAIGDVPVLSLRWSF